MRVNDEVLKCVAFVGVISTEDQGRQHIDYRATGFFVSIPMVTNPNRAHVYFVTARHVADRVEGREFVIRMNTDQNGAIDFFARTDRWWVHP